MEQESSNEEGQEIDFAEILKTSTLPIDLHGTVSGSFGSEAEARELWDTMFAFLQVFGASLNLEGLDAVTVADDYVSALAGIDRGFVTTQAPSPTRDEFGAGFAMSVPVIREGVLKTHIVLDSRLMRPLLDPQSQFYGVAVHTLCHEAAHAHDHLIQSRAFPGLYGTSIPDYRDGVLLNLAFGCWDEYIASRLSATWGPPDYCNQYEDAICSMLETARQRGNAVIDQFSSHNDIGKSAAELVGIYGALFTRASYLVGHIDGLSQTLEEQAPRLFAMIQRMAWFTPLWSGYIRCLSDLHEGYGQWSEVGVFEPLKKQFEVLLNAGVCFSRNFLPANILSASARKYRKASILKT